MSECKEVLKKKKEIHNNVGMSETQKPMSKGVKVEQENKVALDNNSKYKINIYESTLIWITRWKRTGRSPTQENLCKYFVLKKVELNSSRLKCVLYTITSFQKVQCGKKKEKSNFIVEKIDK